MQTDGVRDATLDTREDATTDTLIQDVAPELGPDGVLCTYCSSNEDCGAIENICINLPSGESVCGVDCAGNEERCPESYFCTQIGDEGVRPAFIRKHTRLEIDGARGIGSGIQYAAAEFGGGILNAGSNPSSAVYLQSRVLADEGGPHPLIADLGAEVGLRAALFVPRAVDPTDRLPRGEVDANVLYRAAVLVARAIGAEDAIRTQFGCYILDERVSSGVFSRVQGRVSDTVGLHPGVCWLWRGAVDAICSSNNRYWSDNRNIY